MTPAVTEYTIRPFRGDDTASVLAVINRDRVLGQPAVTEQMLAEAVAGRNDVDSGWWAELSNVTTEVALAATGHVCGVISFARRSRDNAGVILWLHAAENDDVISVLLDRALAQFAGTKAVEAFSFASALTVGLEALPMRHRPLTHAALVQRGFTFEDLWRYMHRKLSVPQAETISYAWSDEDGTRKLRVHDGRDVIAEAAIGFPEHGIGVLWWIGVEPQARARGLGSKLLAAALCVLFELGAEEAILYVDDDEPGGGRDRTAANRLYDRAGFTEIDRLYSYRRTAP